MQQAPPQQQVQYAGLGLRAAAVIVDSAVLFAGYVIAGTVWLLVLVSRSSVDPQDSAAVQALLNERIQGVSTTTYYLVLFGSVFIYYLLLEAVFGASVGKLVLGLRVAMADGSPRTGLAVVVRNLVRIPELIFLYVPAGLSCLASPRRQRLGDHLARTVVVRRPPRVTVVYGVPGQAPPFGQPAGVHPPAPQGPVPPPASAPAAWPAAAAAQAPPAPEPAALDEALARLKTAALAARGAHLTYLTFSERELAAGGAEQTGGYSEAYVSAWFTLTDAVATLKESQARLDAAAAAAGTTSGQAAAAHPDLVHLLAELGPYLAAADDDGVHAAFLAVARAEAGPS